MSSTRSTQRDITDAPLTRGRGWLRGSRLPWLSLLVLGGFTLIAVLAPLVSPHDPYMQVLSERLQPPSRMHPFGTDQLGRDVLSRLIWGARVTVLVGLIGIVVSAGIGLSLGMLAGYFRGAIDSVVSRLIDLFFSFPSIFFGLLLAAIVGPSIRSVVVAISLVVWARFARVIRSEVISLREQEFVAAARIRGCSHLRIMVVHLLPNILATFMVLISFNLGYVVLLESALSFLGAGVPPNIPSWGGMISAGRIHVSSAWWISMFPGLAISMVVLALNNLGDWLRDRLDPKRPQGVR